VSTKRRKKGEEEEKEKEKKIELTSLESGSLAQRSSCLDRREVGRNVAC